jgi:oligoribonuclease
LILWIDTETSGLHNPNYLLEVACVLTHDDLSEVWAWSTIIRNGEINLDRFEYPALKMHVQNDLLNALIERKDKERTLTTREADMIIGSALTRCTKDTDLCPGDIVLGGSNTAFERQIMKQFLPRTLSKIHYRNIDVSVIREACRRWADDIGEWPKNETHRAMDDVRNHIEEANFYRNLLFK